MKNKTMNFLTVSIITIIIACIILFAALGIFMNKKSDKTLNDMGTIYMSGLNERISMHFETIIDMRFSSLQDVIDEIPNEFKQDYENRKSEIGYICAAHDFKYLALYDQEGNFDMLCGEPISLFDPEAFMKTMKNGDKKIAIGKTESDENIVIVGIPYSAPLSNSEKSLAIAAGFPASEMERILALNEQSDIVFSHVIREDGSFVIKSVDAVRENYFDRIRMLFGDLGSKEAEHHIENLKNAMKNQEELSAIFDLDEERRHIYCTELPYSEWYLITVMPYGIMDKTVSNFSRLWILMAILCCAVILGMLTVIFVKYYKITRHQIEDLNNAKKAAESATKAKSEFLSNMSHDIRTHMIRTVVLPSAVDGIVTGCILSVGRIVGESAALLFTAGMASEMLNIFQAVSPGNAGSTLTVALYMYAKERGDFDTAFAISAILLGLTLLINLAAKLSVKILKRN